MNVLHDFRPIEKIFYCLTGTKQKLKPSNRIEIEILIEKIELFLEKK